MGTFFVFLLLCALAVWLFIKAYFLVGDATDKVIEIEDERKRKKK